MTGSLGKCSVLPMIMNAHVVTIYNNYDYSCHLKGNVPRSAQKMGKDLPPKNDLRVRVALWVLGSVLESSQVSPRAFGLVSV